MTKMSAYDFRGKRALIRVDFNVPLSKETLTINDDTRIKAALPTIEHVLKNGGSVVLMSHLGRPKIGYDEKFSLKPVAKHLSKLIDKEVKFARDCMGAETMALVQDLKQGEVLLLENLRFYAQEKSGTAQFAENLSKYGDCYINDAFGTAHRAHASTTVVANYFPNDKMFGFLIENEIIAVDKVLKSSEKPLTAIVGGAKISSKITILKRLIEKVDHLIVGGGMAYTFIKAKGGNVGDSLVEEDFLEMAKQILSTATEKGVQIHLPNDTIIANQFANEAEQKTCDTMQIPNGWMGLDIAKKAIENFSKVIQDSKLILWNGPMGVFEMPSFQKGTEAIALSVVEATSKGAYSLVGGGDSVAAVNQFGLAEKVSYVSTGGGAMLEYLEGKVLPGIQAIQQ